MTINYTTNLSLAEPVTGTESGTWGDDVNKGLTDYLDISIAGTLALTSASFTANALTLANTTGSSSSNGIVATTAQYYILKLSSLAAAVTITAPSSSKTYLVYNSDSTYSATIKASGQSGVSVVAGERALVFFNGTDYVKASSTVLTNFTGVLTGTYGGTGVNNGSNTITIAGNLTHAGAFTQSFTASANTAVTLPAGATAASNNLLSSATAVAIVTGTPSSTTYLRGDGTWATVTAVTPGGSNTYVQYNSSGSFAGSANHTFDGTTMTLGNAGVSARFQGDFSNATFSTRTAFQTGTTNATTGIYALPNGTSTAASWQATNNSDPTNASKILIATNGSTDVQLVSGINGTGTYLPLTFYTSGAEKMRLDTSGNLGLGVTPSAWSTGKAFEIGHVGNAIFDVASSQLTITQNAYYNGGYKYGASTTASRYDQGAGSHIWYTAPSGTAGNAITFTQAMALDNNGNLALSGNASPTLAFNGTANSGGRGILFQYNGTQYGRVTQNIQTGELRITSGESGQTGYFTTFNTNGAEAARISSTGGLSVGTTADPGAGAIYATGNITAYYSSDIKFKENVQDIPDALGIVTAIGSKTFDWTDEYLAERGGEDEYFQPKQSFGVIAQDVQKVFPQAVRTREDGSLAVDYEKLAILSFGAIGQLLKRVEALEAK